MSHPPCSLLRRASPSPRASACPSPRLGIAARGSAFLDGCCGRSLCPASRVHGMRHPCCARTRKTESGTRWIAPAKMRRVEAALPTRATAPRDRFSAGSEAGGFSLPVADRRRRADAPYSTSAFRFLLPRLKPPRASAPTRYGLRITQPRGGRPRRVLRVHAAFSSEKRRHFTLNHVVHRIGSNRVPTALHAERCGECTRALKGGDKFDACVICVRVQLSHREHTARKRRRARTI